MIFGVNWIFSKNFSTYLVSHEASVAITVQFPLLNFSTVRYVPPSIKLFLGCPEIWRKKYIVLLKYIQSNKAWISVFVSHTFGFLGRVNVKNKYITNMKIKMSTRNISICTWKFLDICTIRTTPFNKVFFLRLGEH